MQRYLRERERERIKRRNVWLAWRSPDGPDCEFFAYLLSHLLTWKWIKKIINVFFVIWSAQMTLWYSSNTFKHIIQSFGRAMWADFAKFRNFFNFLIVRPNISKLYLAVVKFWNYFGNFGVLLLGNFFIFLNGQNWTNHLATLILLVSCPEREMLYNRSMEPFTASRPWSTAVYLLRN